MVLNLYLAQAGVASRRKAAELIKDGQVSVNQVTITDPSYRVQETDKIKVGNQFVKMEKKIYILLNKPIGYLSTTADEQERATVLHLIPNGIQQRIYPIGRLDIDTSGLLVITNDGQLAQRLAHPRYEVKKEYVAILNKQLTPEHFEEILKGVYLKDGKVRVDGIVHMKAKPLNWVKVTLHNGRFRIVKRLFAALGYNVKSLDRVCFAGLTKKGLPQGKWRFLNAAEIKDLHTLSKPKKIQTKVIAKRQIKNNLH